MILRVFLLFVFAALTREVYSHELRPAYLQLRETAAESYDVFWKVPGRGENLRLGLYVQVPEGCNNTSEPRGFFADNAFIERWSMSCSGGLSGRRIHITGLAATLTDALVRLERLDGSAQVVRLVPAEPSFVVESAPGRLQVALTYLKLGIEHILTGIDHLLFVLALILITRGGWKLIKTVTAFTVSHSITLTAAALGYVHIPQRPVEAIVALSIVFVAGEILHGYRERAGITATSPWIVAFTFGLLHGLGFAGGLSEVGLPASHIPTALLFFSAGVEIGHLLFVGAVVGLIAVGRRVWGSVPSWAELAPTYAIGSVAMFWVIQRMAAF